jgi:hypothetical protein
MRDLTLRNYLPGDLLLLQVQADQHDEYQIMASAGEFVTDPGGVARTLTRGVRPIACAGIMPVVPGRSLAWASFSDMSRAEWGRVVAEMRRLIAAWDLDRGETRLEATAGRGFVAAGRMLRALGFKLETPTGMRGFIHQQTYDLYARVKP